MDDRGSTSERTEEADHEVDRVVGGKNAEVAHARPKRVQRSEGDALLEIIFVRHHTALRAPAGPRGVDDAGEIFALAGDQYRRSIFVSECFPTLRSRKIGVWRSLGDQNGLHARGTGARRRGRQLAPDGVFGDQNLRPRVLQKLPVFGRSELVVERNQNSAGIENRVSRNQPLGLIGHDDAGAVAAGKASLSQGAGERERAFAEFGIAKALFFAFPIGFDQAGLLREYLNRFLECGSNGGVLREVQHYRRDWMRSARVLKSETP